MSSETQVVTEVDFDFVTHLGTLSVDPEDVIIVKTKSAIPNHRLNMFYEFVNSYFPNNQILVLTEGIDIGKLVANARD